jgi:carbon storage regulator
MLVLSRKSREAVVVGGADGFHQLLKVTVLDIRGGKVQLGFEVDPGIPVHRLEVWERIRADRQSDGIRHNPSLAMNPHVRGKMADAIEAGLQ